MSTRTPRCSRHLYTEFDRLIDRDLCQRYFRGWIHGFGTGTAPVVDGITFTVFEAAADRLVQPYTRKPLIANDLES